jgi:hypothetical protein
MPLESNFLKEGFMIPMSYCGTNQNADFVIQKQISSLMVSRFWIRKSRCLPLIISRSYLFRAIEYPTIDQSTVPSHVDRGEEFTIRLKGDVDLMKSWIPEFQVSGVEYEIMNADMHSVTIKATSGGQMNVTLKHKSLLVLTTKRLISV